MTPAPSTSLGSCAVVEHTSFSLENGNGPRESGESPERRAVSDCTNKTLLFLRGVAVIAQEGEEREVAWRSRAQQAQQRSVTRGDILKTRNVNASRVVYGPKRELASVPRNFDRQ